MTPSDHAFLESSPTYEEGGSLLSSLLPPPMPTPSLLRRVLSLTLFAAVIGTASWVLVMALMRWLHAH